MNLVHLYTMGYHPDYIIIGLIFSIVMSIYFFFRLKKLFEYYDISKKYSLTLRVILIIYTLICGINPWSLPFMTLFYIFIAAVITDIVIVIFKLVTNKLFYGGLKKSKFLKLYKNGALIVIIFLIIVIAGVYQENNVVNTEYNITTDKTNESYTILAFSDLHYANIQSPIVLENKIDEMNNLHPDIIILDGDIVDERVTNEEMHKVFSILGKLNATYGTYFIYGNHDRQPDTTDYIDNSRTYTDEELEYCIKSNGIKILEDESITINDDIVLIGRADIGWDCNFNRKSVPEIVNSNSKNSINSHSLDNSRFNVLVDHRPVDMDNASKVGVDLMIAGHTHGGQLFPYDIATDVLGMPVYGKYVYGKMKLIVSSGFAGWGWPVRNVANSEYVTIHIN